MFRDFKNSHPLVTPRAIAFRLPVPNAPTMTCRFSELNAEIGSFCRQHRVRRLSMFGSAARGERGPLNDIDLLIEFEQGCAPSLAGLERMRQGLASIFGTTAIDLATPSILRNPYRRRAILADLQELYST